MPYSELTSIKQYLSRAYYIDAHITAKLERVCKWRQSLTEPTASLTEIPSHAYHGDHFFSNTIAKICDTEREADAEIDRLIDTKREIQTLIGSIGNSQYRFILEARYLDMHSWAYIACALDCTVRHTHRLHAQALACANSLWQAQTAS